MGFVFSFIILHTFINAAYPVLYPEYEDDAARYWSKNKNEPSNDIQENKIRNNYLKMKEDDTKIRQIKKKAAALRSEGTFKTSGSKIFQAKGIEDEARGFQKDLMLNLLANRRARSDSDSPSSSSSNEMKSWKEEWRDFWLHKKIEALNASAPTGDTVNMAAARPWGVPCGDPNQHDMPWGTCMLPMECEGEFRIYRGDYFCGRTQFVCCALQLTGYDMYQGFDNSLAASSMETDSEEKKDTSKERRRKKRKRDKKKRKNDRFKRKRKIKKSIQNIIREIRKILNRLYRNGTSIRKKKTKQLKNFIKELKKQYRKDRQSVKEIHGMEMIKVDAALMKKLNEIRQMNRNFINNSTFRDIIVNGTMNKTQARMLVEAYPELDNWIGTRRSGDLDPPTDYLDYDIEYGYLYY
ncbi:unnamed protein product [Parnassius mnemosyne]|uniref:Uncharacterized protein n=1 Tax=Parnassius mnemosyne TaxID=213953 RepID=A0AAV1KNY6_9NEOP